MKNNKAAARSRPRRRLAAAAGIALLVVLGLFAASLLGDPLSRAYSVHHAVDYANETWPGQNFQVTEVSFSPGWSYQVKVQSSTSQDTRFSLRVELGVVRSTDYASQVETLNNTRSRIDAALTADVRAAMEAAGIRIDRYSVDIYDAHAPYEENSTDNTWSSGQVSADQIP